VIVITYYDSGWVSTKGDGDVVEFVRVKERVHVERKMQCVCVIWTSITSIICALGMGLNTWTLDVMKN
jgi:hypothetical protein